MLVRLPQACLLALVSCLAFTVSVHAQTYPFTQKPFTDVPQSDPNYGAIEYLRQNNVLKGYLDGTFQPDRRMTRAEFTALLTNPFFLSGRSNDCLKTHYTGSGSTHVFFSDVRLDSWAAQDVCEASVHDIIGGYPDGTFKPNRYISFVESAKIAANVLAIDVRHVDNGGTDAQWYVAYVRRLAELKAIPQGITRFDQPITRGQMAQIVYRLKTGNDTQASVNYDDLH